MRFVLVAAGLLLGAGSRPALAEPAPRPLVATRAVARQPADDLAARRSIRGATVEVRESPELQALRDFERGRFGPERRRELGEENAAGPPERDALDLNALEPPDLPVRFEPRVIRFLEFYKGERRGRSIMSAWLKRQGRYRPLIEESLERHHLPRALLYVSMIESGYDPRDRSSAGAAGLWQFMPEGARIYGLRIDHWIDERNDPEKSTEAVMRYFADLYARFSSWHLALAAFNAGYGAVLASVAKYNTNDYWELTRHENGLPWETTLYVPKVLATAIVGQNRAAFGYDAVAPDAPWSFDRVEVAPSVTLANVARAAGVTLEAVAALNPELRRDRTPPEPWMVRLPRGAGPRFEETYEPSHERVKSYVVKQGDRLESLAKTFHTSASELKRLNTIRDVSEVRPGVVLVVPDRSKGEARADAKAEGDEATLVAVPDRDAQVEGRRRVFYRVVPGDGLSEIASFFRVSDEDLARWNHLDPEARLFSSQILQVWVEPDFDVKEAALDPAHLKLVTVGSDEFFDAVEAKRGRRRLRVAVREGDTLKKIGERYGLKEADMERINRMPRTTELVPGQTVVVYVPAKKEPEPAALPALPPGTGDEPAAGGSGVEARGAAKVDLDDAPALPVPAPPPAEDPSFPEVS